MPWPKCEKTCHIKSVSALVFGIVDFRICLTNFLKALIVSTSINHIQKSGASSVWVRFFAFSHRKLYCFCKDIMLESVLFIYSILITMEIMNIEILV